VRQKKVYIDVSLPFCTKDREQQSLSLMARRRTPG